MYNIVEAEGRIWFLENYNFAAKAPQEEMKQQKLDFDIIIFILRIYILHIQYTYIRLHYIYTYMYILRVSPVTPARFEWRSLPPNSCHLSDVSPLAENQGCVEVYRFPLT